MLHARAIGWPDDRFEYLGIDDDGDTTAHYAGEVRRLLTPSIPEGKTDKVAEIRIHTLSILPIRLSSTPINQEITS
jgi:hypothetical protein